MFFILKSAVFFVINHLSYPYRGVGCRFVPPSCLHLAGCHVIKTHQGRYGPEPTHRQPRDLPTLTPLRLNRVDERRDVPPVSIHVLTCEWATVPATSLMDVRSS